MTARSAPLLQSDRMTETTDRANIDLSLYTGFTISASDGKVGTLDEATRDLSHPGLMVVSDRGWLGKKLLLPVDAIAKVDEARRTIMLDLSRDMVKNAPKFDARRWQGSPEIGDNRSMPLTPYPFESESPQAE